MAGPARNNHGTTIRGLDLTRGSRFFGGQFGRMFRSLPPADFGSSDTKTEENLLALGQAIDHDLTFDPASSLQQQDDPEGLVDFRTPRFDLDNLYGKGPDDAPYL